MSNDAQPPNQQPAPPSASKWIFAQLLINVFGFLLFTAIGVYSQSQSLTLFSMLFFMLAGLAGATYAAVRELEEWVARKESGLVEQAREQGH